MNVLSLYYKTLLCSLFFFIHYLFFDRRLVCLFSSYNFYRNFFFLFSKPHPTLLLKKKKKKKVFTLLVSKHSVTFPLFNISFRSLSRKNINNVGKSLFLLCFFFSLSCFRLWEEQDDDDDDVGRCAVELRNWTHSYFLRLVGRGRTHGGRHASH